LVVFWWIVLPASRAGSLLQKIGMSYILRPALPLCGSEPARDDGLTGNGD
jgi:hypothetical protein